MEKNFETIQDLFNYVKKDFDDSNRKNKVALRLMFASNTSGKTRLSEAFREEDKQNLVEDDSLSKVLCYNSFFEDYFHWDNEKFVLKLDKYSWISKFIEDEGLDAQIIDNFKNITNSKFNIEFNQDGVCFGYYLDGYNELSTIKISRAEESQFIWCVFYTILKRVIELLSENKESRSTNLFNELKYIIIDDPVSSMDDNRIITLALDLIQLIKQININKLNILITTHHCLFYNILHSNSIKEFSIKRSVLKKKEDNTLSLDIQNKDSPFAYHLILLEEIKKAVDSDNIKKYHCNFLRSILEKTANFFGYNGWQDLLHDNALQHEYIAKLLNSYSHNSLAEIEYSSLELSEKEIFKREFNNFFEKFHWKVKESNDKN